MFERLLGLWMKNYNSATIGKKHRATTPRPAVCRAKPRLELLEDRCLLAAGISVSHMSNNNWTEGFAGFTGEMTINGGTAPYTIVSDGNLPPGVTPTISGDFIRFTGAPNVSKTFSNCDVTIKDADGATASKTFVIDVEPALVLGNLTQTEWTVGEAGFYGAISIVGGTGPVALVGSSGLPTGLGATLSGRTIDFTGTPTAVGTFSHGSVTVKDADGAMDTETFSITINPAMMLSTLTVTAWTGAEGGFPGTISISGGTGPYAIAEYGSIPFTPAVAGNTVYFTGTAASQDLINGFVTVSDKTGATVTEIIPNFNINLQPTSNDLTTSQWTVNQPGYDGTISINDGTTPFTITAARNLPTGLTAEVSGSTISFVGTPTAAQSFAGGAITLRDVSGASITIPISITINPALAFTTASLPGLTSGANYSTTLKSTGGTGADVFTLMSGSLPPGLTLNSNGKISGEASTTNAYTFTAAVTDAIGDRVTKTFTIAASPSIGIGNLTQTQWTIGEPNFDGTMAISGGAGTFMISSVSGLPAGLSATLSGTTITIAGEPLVSGKFASGSITVTDSGGVSATETFSITINPVPTFGALSLTQWTGNVAGFTGTIAILGGMGPFTIVKSSGLPFTPQVSGNSIIFTGLAGPGYYPNGSITVVDKAGAGGTVKVAPITINPQAIITHMSVNNWTEGLPNFPGVLTIVGGTGPFTVAELRNIPPGLTPVVSGDTIGFKGTPTAAGTFENCTVTIEDAAGILTTKIFLIALAPPLEITNASLPAWRSGVSYNATLNTVGGNGPDTFSLASGVLPPGLTLKSDGRITGLATGIGSYTFTVTVTDELGDKFSETFTL